MFAPRAGGDARSDSDVDLLVQFGNPMGAVAYMRFIEQVERALEREIDVITEKSLNRHLRSRIESDLQIIYES